MTQPARRMRVSSFADAPSAGVGRRALTLVAQGPLHAAAQRAPGGGRVGSAGPGGRRPGFLPEADRPVQRPGSGWKLFPRKATPEPRAIRRPPNPRVDNGRAWL